MTIAAVQTIEEAFQREVKVEICSGCTFAVVVEVGSEMEPTPS